MVGEEEDGNEVGFKFIIIQYILKNVLKTDLFVWSFLELSLFTKVSLMYTYSHLKDSA